MRFEVLRRVWTNWQKMIRPFCKNIKLTTANDKQDNLRNVIKKHVKPRPKCYEGRDCAPCWPERAKPTPVKQPKKSWCDRDPPPAKFKVELGDTMEKIMTELGMPKPKEPDIYTPRLEPTDGSEKCCKKFDPLPHCDEPEPPCVTPETQAERCAPKPPQPQPVPGNEVLWQNIKQALLICGGQEQPLCEYPANMEAPQRVLIDVLEAQRFISAAFAAMDVPDQAASQMADALIAADYMGHRSMGIHRLPAIAADLLNRTVEPRNKPSVQVDKPAMALVNGNNAPGPVVANYCMDVAINKAREHGVGWVAAHHSNCIGMACWYACQAMTHRLIGLCMTNAPPTLVPSGGIEPVLGENPIACYATGYHEQFIMDLGMSGVPIEQLELAYCSGKLRCMPQNYALDRNGRPTGCVREALSAQRLRPFKPDHKGFGLAAMVDVLCGVMTGANYATQIRRRGVYSPDNPPANLGQVFIALDPKFFNVDFDKRLVEFHRLLRGVLPCDACKPPMVPGDKEALHLQQVDDQGGFECSPCTLLVLEELAGRFNIEPLKVLAEA